MVNLSKPGRHAAREDRSPVGTATTIFGMTVARFHAVTLNPAPIGLIGETDAPIVAWPTVVPPRSDYISSTGQTVA